MTLRVSLKVLEIVELCATPSRPPAPEFFSWDFLRSWAVESSILRTFSADFFIAAFEPTCDDFMMRLGVVLVCGVDAERPKILDGSCLNAEL